MATSSVILLALSTFTATWLPSGDHIREFPFGGLVRSYSIHIPPSYSPTKQAPVVLVFHSALMNAPLMARFCGLSEKADRSGFVVVYANGTGSTPVFRYWDAGGVHGRRADDVGYVAKLLDDLGTVVNVDPKRIFATGMSNGAMMCYRLAAEMSERIAAIAPVAGTMAIDHCQPRRAGLGLAFSRHQRRTGALWRAERANAQGHLVPFRRRDDPDLGSRGWLPGSSAG